MTLIESNEIKDADLILIRGIPGSGKTTYVKNNLKGYKHYEADQFFEKDGKYNFDATKLREAHNKCYLNTKKSLRDGDKVVVSNTFTRKWELEQYLKLAKNMNKKVKVLRTTKQFKNVHNIPNDKVQEMKDRFEDVDGEVKI